MFVESKNGFKQQRGGFLLILSASSHVKCGSCWLQCQKMDFSFQDLQYQSTDLLVTSFTTHQRLSLTFYDLDGLFLLHKSLLLPYEPLYVTDGSGGQLWAISVSLCEVSLPGINLMHKHTNTNQSCLLSSTTRPMQPVLFIKAKPCRNPELCTSLKRLIRPDVLYSEREKKSVFRVNRGNKIKHLVKLSILRCICNN